MTQLNTTKATSAFAAGWCSHGNVGRAVRPNTCDDLLEWQWGSATVQRRNVTNPNGVHFSNVSGNLDLLGQNCGEHKPKTVSCTESNRRRSQGR